MDQNQNYHFNKGTYYGLGSKRWDQSNFQKILISKGKLV